MIYGLGDVTRNAFGIRSRSEVLRPEEFWAVDDVSLEIERGETVGLIGPNGSGKTTLLRMLNGIFWPDRGEIQVRGRVGALIAVGAGFHPLLTGRENIYINAAILGMSRSDVDRNFDAIVEFADIGDFLDTPVKHYSSGMYVRLGFAVAAYSEPDIMLVDEVLAVGDRGFQVKCFKRMGELREAGTTFVVVSHNMHTVAGFVDWVALLHDGKLERFDNVFDGVQSYSRLFLGDGDETIEKLTSGGQGVEFRDVTVSSQKLKPGGSFSLSMSCESREALEDVEVDIAIYDTRDPDLYHQATNSAFGQRVDLPAGKSSLEVEIGPFQLHGSFAKVAVAIWTRGRKESIFWWRIPLELLEAPHAAGKNLVPTSFRVKAAE